MQKINQKEFGTEKVIKRKVDKLYAKWKGNKNKVEVNLNLSNYATKSVGVDTQFAKKDDIGNLKSWVDKLDIDKLEKVPSSLNSMKSKVDNLDIS